MIQPNADTHPFLRSVADCIDQRVQAEVDAALATLDTAQPIANSLGLSRMPMLWLRYRDEVAQELHRQIERRLCQEVADKLVQPWGRPEMPQAPSRSTEWMPGANNSWVRCPPQAE